MSPLSPEPTSPRLPRGAAFARPPGRRSLAAVPAVIALGALGALGLITLAAVAGAPLAAAETPTTSPSTRTTVDRIVLRVNDRIATLRDYERRLDDRIGAIMAAELPSAQRQELLARASEDALHEVFEELLILSRADQLVIQLSESDLDRAVDEAKKRAGIEDEARFAQALQEAGLTVAGLRDRLRRTEISQEVIGREVQPRIKVTEEVLQRTYRENLEQFRIPAEVKLREVVVLDEATADPTARELLVEEIVARLGRGATLDEIAAQHAASGAVSAVMDLGFVRVDELDAGLAKAVEGLAVGAVSGPVAARGGTHFLQVLGRRESTIRPFDEVEGELRARERNRLFEQELGNYMQELEERSYIVADPPAEAAGFRAKRRNVRTDELAQAMAAADQRPALDEATAGSEASTAPAAEGGAPAAPAEPTTPTTPTTPPAAPPPGG